MFKSLSPPWTQSDTGLLQDVVERDFQLWDSGIALFGSLGLKEEWAPCQWKWDANNPWHAVTSQLIKISPVVVYNKVTTEATALVYSTILMTVRTVMWDEFLLSALQCLQREKWKTQVCWLSAQVMVWASMTALKKYFISYRHRSDLAKIKHPI